MKKAFLFFVLAFCVCLHSNGQDVQKDLKTEEDGFKWYLLYSNGFSGAQDVNGKEIIPLSKKFDGIGYRADLKLFQITVFKDDILTGFYGLDGKSLIEPGKYDNANYWNETGKPIFFTVEKGGKSGVCDKDGKEVIPLLYDKVYHSNGNYFEVYKGEYRGICDMTGHFTLPLSAQYTLILYEPETGCYAVHKGDKLRGICKTDGTFLIPLSRNYELCNYEKEGWYQIKKNGYYGVCDLSGKEVVKPDKYKSMLFYEDGKGVYTYDENYNSITLYKLKGKSSNYSSNNNSYAYTTTTTTTTSQSSSIKDMFDLAYNTPDTEAQTKYNRYMQVIQADPYNTYGYKAPAYNNLGVLYETLGDLKNAKACYEYALQTNPNYDKAKDNLKNVKAQRRSQRWNNISNALGAVGQALGTMSGGQTNGTYNTYQGGGDSHGGSSSGGYSGGSGSSTCKRCQGSGRCSSMSGTANKYYCHGSGKCGYCNGSGIVRNLGQTITCTACNGRGRCKYCNGSGKCSDCGGSGKR